jgi:hypothetical protein
VTSRSGIRPSFLSIYSLFDHITRIRRITTGLLTAVLLSNQVAAATLGTAPIAAATGEDLRYEFYSSGWAKSLGIHLTSTAQGSGNELDGRGAQRGDRPAPARAETKADRETKVARIKIYPGDVEIAAGGQVIFTAAGLDSDGNAIGGLDVRWECLHEDRGRRITVRQGSFSSPIAGRFIITAEIAVAGSRSESRSRKKAPCPGSKANPRSKSTPASCDV